MARRAEEVGEVYDDQHDSGVHELGGLIADDLRRQSGRGGNRRRNPIIVALLVVIVVGIAATAVYFGKQFISGFGAVPDYAGNGDKSVSVRINSGDSLSTIASTLEKSDVVKSAKSFTEAAKDSTEANSIQPGLYALKTKMSGKNALKLLLTPAARLTRKVTIPEGYTVAQTLAAISEKANVPLADLQSALKDVQNLGLPKWLPNANVVLEGFLAPGTYEFDPDDTPLEILQNMVANFQQQAGQMDFAAGAKAVGQTPYSALIIASLIEREAKWDDERGKIARVIYNRLAVPMPLQIDASTAYGAGKSGKDLTVADLQNTANPYNLRVLPGLPPTPISNVSEASMKAAISPDAGPWLYYVVNSADGHHFFTNDPAAFNAAVAQCKANGWC